MRQNYTLERIQTLRSRAQRAAWAAGIIVALGLAACVCLCFGIRTKNADARRIAVIAVSTLASWAAVTLAGRVRLPLLREAAHEEGVLKEKAELAEGTLAEVGAPHPIPKSITFLPVTVKTEDGGEASLKLNAIWAKDFPKPEERICVETHRGYITAWETDRGAKPENAAEDTEFVPSLQESSEGENAGKQRPSRVYGFPRLSHGLGCLILSALLWSWIFTFLTDADPAQKITLYADMHNFPAKQLSIALEEEAPEGIRFVQAHPFSYALMDSAALERADLYIMTEKRAEEYAEWIVPESATLLYDAEAGISMAGDYLNYKEQPGENWYLYEGAQSVHTEEGDGAVLSVMERLLVLP